MNNPQINKLKSMGYLNKVIHEIIEILRKYSSKEQPLCSHNILGLSMNSSVIIEGLSICLKDTQKSVSGYSVPASWIGSVCSYMVNKNMIRMTKIKCTFNDKDDPFWYI